MLCPRCHRQVLAEAPICTTCGHALRSVQPPLEVVLADGTRLPTDIDITIGRGPGNALRLEDGAVSRFHAVIRPQAAGGASIEDAGSSHGTLLDGSPVTVAMPLVDGSTVRIGDTVLRIERRRSEAEAGKTMVMRPGASIVLPTIGRARNDAPVTATSHPRIRSGWALKRLDASEGERRFVLRDLNGDGFIRMGAVEGALLPLLDGTRTIADLLAEAERRFGNAGPAGLARLLADLGDRGMLSGIEGREKIPEAKPGLLRRLFTPRRLAFDGAAATIDRIYGAGGWLLFTRAARWLLGALVVGGLASFAYLIIGSYGTPFVVAKKVGLGGVVFMVGRLAIAAVHETAHALTVASFGRKVGAFGLKLVMVFPYVFVDTTEAWFESRPRRMAVSAAGPVCDLSIGGIAALAALGTSAGTLRDVFFQLALASYIGAFFNLNPLLDRDGYAMLVDGFGEPGLRRRSRQRLMAVLAGHGDAVPASRAVTVYGFAAIGWSIVGIGFAAVMATRYLPIVEGLVGSRGLAKGLFAALFALMLAPIAYSVIRPLMMRRQRPAEASDG